MYCVNKALIKALHRQGKCEMYIECYFSVHIFALLLMVFLKAVPLSWKLHSFRGEDVVHKIIFDLNSNDLCHKLSYKDATNFLFQLHATINRINGTLI